MEHPRITLTGADEGCRIEDLVRLASRPGVEIGILFSANPEGRHMYPSVPWIEQAVAALGDRCAVHVCGLKARREALDGRHSWLARVGRIQINGAITWAEVEEALRVNPAVITQYPNVETAPPLADIPGHCLLVDRSGGRGIRPEEWTHPGVSKPVGFAGGLGPDNLAAELPRIAAVAREPWWIDMESGLRDEEDWFRLRRAHKCVDILEAWAKGRSALEVK